MVEGEAEFVDALAGVAETLGIELDERRRELFLAHYRLLVRWNRRINLTAIREPGEIARRHFGESLFLSRRADLSATLVDVGSGAGFPGLPVAADRPELLVTLVESVGKKAVFLEEASRELENVEVFAGRLEAFTGRSKWASLRAVGTREVLGRLARVSENVALLTSLDSAREIARDTDFEWKAPLRLPWGERRVLLIGSAAERST